MKLLLCDAVIIIDAHNLGIWKILKSHYRIHFASTVLKEAQYFKDDLQVKHYLDFKKDIDHGLIIKISMPIKDIQAIIKKTQDKNGDKNSKKIQIYARKTAGRTKKEHR